MPTGYTSIIYHGEEVSGSKFILHCARAFGATIDMRDEPFDKEIPKFEPNDYSLRGLSKAKKEKEEVESISLEKLEKEIEESYILDLERYYNRIKEIDETEARYLKVLSEVKAWNPPTEDHIALKNYAVNQIEESIKADCNRTYAMFPSRRSPEEYRTALIERAERDILYYEKEWQAELERVNSRNKWVDELKSSLKGLK